jgi:hypothetical protein
VAVPDTFLEAINEGVGKRAMTDIDAGIRVSPTGFSPAVPRDSVPCAANTAGGVSLP